MQNKMFHKVTVSLEEHNVEIYPTEDFSGIVIEAKELDDRTSSPRIYLSKTEMEFLVQKMQEMMDFCGK